MRLRRALPDVPSASLYRHIKISVNCSVLEAAGENRIAVGYMKRKAAKCGNAGNPRSKNGFESCHTRQTRIIMKSL